MEFFFFCIKDSFLNTAQREKRQLFVAKISATVYFRLAQVKFTSTTNRERYFV